MGLLRPMGVLADDLSGAAEVAGAALRYGLRAEVATEVGLPIRADVFCVDANTRAASVDDAVLRTAIMTAQLRAAGVAWLFKKTDSILRGHVRREIDAMLDVTGQRQCLLCPANPSRERTVSGGRYFIAGVPLEQTVFAHDLIYPRHTSAVADLLGGDSPTCRVPDVTSRDDLRALAMQVDDATLPAGAVEFFEELLAVRGYRPEAGTSPQLAGGRLFVCGSPAAWATGRAQQAAEHGIVTVCLRPGAIDQAAMELTARGKLLLAIGDAHGDSQTLAAVLADAVAELVVRCPVEFVFLEGGATALAVLHRLGWTNLRAVAELERGTVMLEETSHRLPRLIIKPGSYPWPPQVWEP